MAETPSRRETAYLTTMLLGLAALVCVAVAWCAR